MQIKLRVMLPLGVPSDDKLSCMNKRYDFSKKEKME